MSERKTGPDLLRCIALLLVVTFHSFLNNGYYSQPQTGFWMWLAGSVRWLSTSCIGLFLMLTGYLCADKIGLKDCYRRLGPVLLGYLLAAVISVPVRHFALGDQKSFIVWSERLFGFSAVYYGWYVEMYVGLVLLMPFVNRLLAQLQRERSLLVLGAVLLALTALPGATELVLFPDYWRGFYPLTYYVLGAIVKRLQPKPQPWLGIVAAAGIAALLGAATLLSTDGKLNDGLTWEFPDLWVTAMALCLFTALYRVKMPRRCSRILAFGASGCYGGYLLSHLFDSWCYRLLPGWHTPERYILLFVCVTIPIWLLSILPGAALERLAKRLCQGRKGAAQ